MPLNTSTARQALAQAKCAPGKPMKARLTLLISLFSCLVIGFISPLQAQTSRGKRANLPAGTPSLIRFNTTKQVQASKSSPQLLEDNLGMKAHDRLVKTTTSSDRSGYSHQKYQQYYKGLKVEHGIYAVHTKNAAVQSISGEFYSIPDLSITPSLSEKDALQRALRFTGATKYMWDVASQEKGIKSIQKDPRATYFPKAELLICQKLLHQAKGGQAEMALAYKFDVYAQQPLSRDLIYVDAHSGEIIYKEPIIKHADGQAATRYSGTRTIQTQNQAGLYQLKDSTRGVAIETYNMNTGTDYSAATNFTDADNNWTSGEFDNDAKDNAALDAHWGSMMTYDYFLTKHGRNSFDNQGSAIRSYVHFDYKYENAFWDGVRMTYGDGNTWFDAFTSLDIVGHEIGHGVCQHTANLIYYKESGALNEGLSDIWGAMIEHFAAPEKNTWLLGEEIMKQTAALRSMSDPNSQGQPDTYLGNYWFTDEWDNGGVHTNSGVLNHWFYLLSVGKTGTNDHGYNYQVTGIGMEKAADIVYRTESVYLTATSQYIHAREFSIQAATDLYGANSNEVKQVINAWNAVGVYEVIPAPSNLTAMVDSATTVNLSWQDNTTDETGFQIERSTNSNSDFVQIATVKANITSYTETGLPTNAAYYYQVKTIKDNSLSLASNTAIVMLGTVPRTVPESDSLALVALYRSTTGENWKTNTNWLTGQVASWFGVTVTAGRVTLLRLPGNQLIGSIPDSLGHLSALVVLDVSKNQLSGSIPASLGNLTMLNQINLAVNQLSGSIPDSLGHLSALVVLNVSNNQLSGSIPASLGNLTMLNQINLAVNQLSGSIPDSLGNMKALLFLNLDMNKLSGSIPAELGNMKALLVLNLAMNKLSGSIPTSLGNLSALQVLSVWNNQLSGSLPVELGTLSALQVLWLDDNKLSGSIPTTLGSLPALTSLYFNTNQFTSLPAFVNNVNEFYVQQNQLTFESLEPNISKLNNPPSYAPQDSVLLAANVALVAGTSVELSALVGGANNRYQWTLNGVDVNGATNATLTVTAAGTYGCKITNTVVTGLTLHRRQVNVSVSSAPVCQATGKILREVWTNLSGSRITDIPVLSPPNLTSQLTSLQAPANFGDRYGQRLRGYICAPKTGAYTFWLVSDNDAQLFLSTDAEPAHKQVIAFIKNGYALPGQWTKYPSQKSVAINLVAGQQYYLEAIHKEEYGGDNLIVGWRTPASAANATPVI
ncbi:MAG: M4 family metallopeptidase, partial [Bacteroidota bacterium]